jgi:hypothetical protein
MAPVGAGLTGAEAASTVNASDAATTNESVRVLKGSLAVVAAGVAVFPVSATVTAGL